ncbi:RNA repair domain-containing protein [Methanocaldococcus sp.]|uniref:RNA repair domain-containing protein n=1 Tax=Methanocaldococcus sp. TaxID=2152917 RepID=UPI0026198303|nr:RNA repair domain-containing protein [Methanocaldococcus sp.]MCQ6254277.1 RNA repair domain-containing protein [Methanocaldococcus sp.]
MLKEILNKLFWHPNYKDNIDNFEIVIIHRGGKDNKKVIPLSEVKIKGNYLYLIYEDTYIPLHRILEIRNKMTGEVLYKKIK